MIASVGHPFLGAMRENVQAFGVHEVHLGDTDQAQDRFQVGRHGVGVLAEVHAAPRAEHHRLDAFDQALRVGLGVAEGHLGACNQVEPVLQRSGHVEVVHRCGDQHQIALHQLGDQGIGLEARLGTPLFQRTTRSQRLTEVGAIYFEHCLRAMEEIRAGEAALEGGRTQVAGLLRVSMPVLFGHLCVTPILVELVRQHASLSLDLQFSDRPVDLREENVDLAIRVGTLADSRDLIARPLGEHRMALCASPAYLARQSLPESLEALMALDAVAYSRHGKAMEWRLVVDGQEHLLKPRARVLLDDMQGVLVTAAAGMGVAWLPYWLVRDALMEGRLQEVFPAASSPVYPIHAVWPKMPHMPLKTRVAVDALLQQLPGRLREVEGPGTWLHSFHAS